MANVDNFTIDLNSLPLSHLDGAESLSYFDADGIKSIQAIEDTISENYYRYGLNEKVIDRLQCEIDRARTRWACISAKSQRDKKSRYGWEVQNFDNLVTFKEVHNTPFQLQEPPNRQGERITGYSEASQRRLMQRMRKMRKSELPLPYFVHLTYHENMLDFKKSKSHLNAWFQRFRRLGITNYVWKMEPQSKNFKTTGRAAIHFHVMFFPPEEMYPAAWKKSKKTRLEYMRLRCSTWNEIIEGSRENLQVGTRVDPVDNWKMAAGYMAKYMEKSVDGEVWKGLNPGRFWGMSRGFNFDAISVRVYDRAEMAHVVDVAQKINKAAYMDMLRYCTMMCNKRPENAQKYMNYMYQAARKYGYTMEKLRSGGYFQFEMDHRKTTRIMRKYGGGENPIDYFQ